MLFTDSQGNEVDRLQGRGAQEVISKIESVVKAHSKAPGASDGAGSLAEVAEQAVKDGKLVAVMFVDPKKAKKQEALQAALDADEVAQLKERFVWVEQPVKVEGKRNPVARALGVSSGPYLVLIDPRGEGELDKKKVIGKINNAKKLQETLEKAVEKADSREE